MTPEIPPRSLEDAMRRGPLLLLPAAVLALAGFDHAPAAKTPLSVDSVYCQAYSTWRFSCVATVSGGSGVYNSYDWDWPLSYSGPGGAWTYVNEVEGHCGGGDGFVTVEVTVTDSNWNTATGYGGLYCTYNGE
jgi:hypothetical protein